MASRRINGGSTTTTCIPPPPRVPFPNDRFAVKFHYERTPKSGPMKGKRMQMDEVGVDTVRNGKIVREEFFYSM